MASKKRRREKNKRERMDFDKENEDPGTSCYIPRKKPKRVSKSQTSTSSLPRVKDGNVGSSLDGHLVLEGGKSKSGEVQEQHENTGHAERNPSVYGEKEMFSGEDLKQDGELALSDKNHKNNSPWTIDSYFPKAFKTRSPCQQQKKCSNVVDQGENTEREALEQLGGISAVLQQRAKSVCLIHVVRVCQGKEETVITGTGFVYIGMLIMTNAHVLRDCLDGYMLQGNIIIYARFNYDGPDPNTKSFYFTAEKLLTDFDSKLDFAIFQLKPEGQKPNQQTRVENFKVPPGLLKFLVSMHEKVDNYIIGHPAGGVRKYDKIRIIDPENRKQAVKDHLTQYKNSVFTSLSVEQIIKNQGIDRVMEGGEIAEEVVTYHSSMQEGSSGSPLLDEDGNLLGLHTGGFNHGFPNHTIPVMAYSRDLSSITEKLVSELRKRGEVQMLEMVKLEASENLFLKRILEAVPMEIA